MLLIGSVGPWAKGPLGITANGTDGDGVITLGLGVIAIAALVNGAKLARVVAGLAGIAASVIGIVDMVQISNAETDLFGESVQVASAGWGIWVTAISGLALTFVLAIPRPND